MADDFKDYAKELGLRVQSNQGVKEFLNTEISKLFEEDGKFHKKLNVFFKSVNKSNNIEFISIERAQREILEKLKEEALEKLLDEKKIQEEETLKNNLNKLLDEKEIEELEENFRRMEEFFFKFQNPFEDQSKKTLTKKQKDLILKTQKGFMIDFSKSLSIFYTNFAQEKNCLLTDFDTKKENLNLTLDENEKWIKFSLMLYKKLVFQSIKEGSEKIDQNFVSRLQITSNENFCHFGLVFSPKSFQKFFLFLIKNSFLLAENPFLIPKKISIMGKKQFTSFFGQNFEWIFDDFVNFVVQNNKSPEYFEKTLFSEFEKDFKNFFDTRYKCLDRENYMQILEKIFLDNLNSHFFLDDFFKKIHLFSNQKQELNYLIAGNTGNSWEKDIPQETQDINTFLNSYKRKFCEMQMKMKLKLTRQPDSVAISHQVG
jgi:hypothetical protein